MRLIRFCLFALAALAPIAGYAQAYPAGTVTLLNGEAQAVDPAGSARGLAKGASVYEGDSVETAAASYALVSFTDQGSVLLRPNSRFQVERYHYNGAAAPAAPAAAAAAPAAAPQPAGAAPESSFFRLLKGGLRAVSGLIAHANYSNYRMSAPTATMGIRGTDFEAVLCEGPCLSDPTVLQAVPPGANLNGAVVTGVNDGQIVVTSTTGKSLVLNPGQYAITLADGNQYLLNGIPAFLTTQSGELGESGVAAGGSLAASNVAAGNLLVVGGVAVLGIGPALGMLLSGSGNQGTSTSTSTSTGR
jgi:hypothetical protein